MKTGMKIFLKLQTLFELGRWTVEAHDVNTGALLPDLPPYKVHTFSRWGAQQLAKALNKTASANVRYSEKAA